jgi:hypothetical protein
LNEIIIFAAIKLINWESGLNILSFLMFFLHLWRRFFHKFICSCLIKSIKYRALNLLFRQYIVRKLSSGLYFFLFVTRKPLIFIFAFIWILFGVVNNSWGQITQVTNSPQTGTTTGTTLTITKPSGLAIGDVMIAHIVQSDNDNATLSDATLTGTNSWTIITGSKIGETGGAGSNQEWWGTLLYKVATAYDISVSDYTFTLDDDANGDGCVGAVTAFSGVDVNGGIFDVSPGTINTSGNISAVTASAITTTTDNAAVIMFSMLGDNRTHSSWTTTSPGNLTELYDVPFNTSLDNGLGAAWAIKSSAGNTGQGTATLNNSSRNGGILIALKPNTSPPSCTNLISPANIATNVSASTSLIWNPVSGATGYYLYLGTDASATNIENGTDLGNITSYTPSANLNFLTNYYWKIVPYNSFGTATGCSVWSFTTEDISYCIPNYATGTVEGDYVALVQLGDINNTTIGSSSPYYTFYSSLTTNLTLSNNYTITLGSGTYSSQNNISVWIDYNYNGTFDTSEKLGNVTLSGNSTGTINFTIPPEAITGTTRMRVKEVYNTSNIDPCANYTWGETEDYNVNIVSACTNATLTLNTGNANQTVCNDKPITVITYTVGGDATGAGVSGLPAGVSGNYNTGTVTISGTPTASGTFNYTVTTAGTPSGCSEATATGTITVNPLPSAPTANNVTSTYNGTVQSALANVGAGETVDWYTSATGGSPAVAPTGTNVNTYTAWAEARNTTTGCTSASRTQVTLIINKKNLQVTATAPNITYGDAAPVVSVQYSGFVGSENASVLDNTGFILETNYTLGNPVGNYNTSILIGTATDNNYNFSPLISSIFSVGKKDLFIIANNQTVEYGSHDGYITLNGTYTISGFVNSDNSSVITGLGSVSYVTSYTETTNAGTPGITITPVLTGLSSENYNLVPASGSITITKADQFISCTCVPFTKPLNEFDTIPIGASSSSGLPVIITLMPGSVATLNGSPGSYSLTDIGLTGNVTLFANQAGDSNYNPATQGIRSFDVTKSNQNISFPAIDNLTYYTGLTMELGALATSGLEVSYTVVSGPATITGNILTITGTGEIWIRANQPGDASYNAAASVLQSFTVNKGPQTITINVQSGPLSALTQITATSTSGLPVTLTLGTGSAATSLDYNAVGGYYTLSGIGGSGNIYIVGNQAGDANFMQAPQIIQTIVIGKTNQTITFVPIANQIYSPTLTITLTATASSGLTVSFAVVSGPATITGNTLTVTGAGTVILDANQSGDGTYNPAPTVTQQFEVEKATPVIIQADITKAFEDAPFTINPSSPSSGSYSFISGNDDVFTISGNTATILGAGTTTLDITQQPTANYNGATKTVLFSVNKTASIISMTGTTEYTYNGTHQGPETSTVTGSTGAVTYSYTGTGSTGYGPVSMKPIDTGEYTATATVAADENYSGATSTPYAFTISKADAIINVTPYSVIYNSEIHTATGAAEGVLTEALAGLDLSGTIHTDAGTYNNDPWTFTDVTGNYNNASGTVNNIILQKDLTITASNQEKCFGETYTFDGTEFTSAGLEDSETIGTVTLTSPGAVPGAAAGTYSISPSVATGGTFNPANYNITYTDGVMLVNPLPTLTIATQVATVCEGNAATINLSGLLAGTTFTLEYSINSVVQTPVSGLLADGSGNSSFSTPVLSSSNNGQVLQITGITVTSETPNCSQSFTLNVSLRVNPLPTLTGASLESSVCDGSAATINLNGLQPGLTFSLNYTINGGTPLLINGLTADGSGNSSFITSSLSLVNNGQILQIEWIEDETTGCNKATAQTVVLEVDPLSVGGIATATDVSLCENNNTSITLTGYTGRIQWQQSADGTTGWANVIGGSGETTDTYITPDLTTKTYYRAKLTSGNCTLEYSTTAEVTVNPLPTLASASQLAPVCEGVAATINLTGLLPGATFSLSYTISGGAPVLVTGLTADGSGNSALSTQALTIDDDGETLEIVEIEDESSGCIKSFTQEIPLSVDPVSVAGTVSADQTICSGNAPADITLTSETGEIQWQISTDNVAFSDISDATSTSLTSAQIGTLTATTYFRAKVTSGVCVPDYSDVVTINVNSLPTITLSATEAGVCIGDIVASMPYLATTGGSNQYSIDFDTTAEGQGFIDVTDATLSGGTINIEVPATGIPDTYNAILTVINSTTGCNSANYNITVKINPLPDTSEINSN